MFIFRHSFHAVVVFVVYVTCHLTDSQHTVIKFGSVLQPVVYFYGYLGVFWKKFIGFEEKQDW